VAGNLLFSREICPVKPLAYAEQREKGVLQEAFYLAESPVEDVELDRYLVRKFEKPPRLDLRRFITQFAGWIGSIHQAGIYHRDLKTCNILVREKAGGWSFSLIDLEDVSHGTRIGEERILKNLVQINCSVPRFLSYGDRVRFLKGYLEVNPVVRDQRGFISTVLEESRRRGILFVSPTGVVTDEFE
jgi:serine/threonine protein kinase